VDVDCSPDDHRSIATRSGLDVLPRTIEKPEALGIDIDKLKSAAGLDDGIAEFSRFYLQRREYETKRTGDERKLKKLNDEFTPRVEMTLVGLQGQLRRHVQLKARYSFDGEDEYESVLTVSPFDAAIIGHPKLGLCSKSARTVPISCLAKCEITGAEALRHYLVKSDVSERLALPEFTVVCAHSGKRVFRDEADVSDVTGKLVSSDLLKASALSGKRAEPEYFGSCDFTESDCLNDELAVSDLSGKRYRIDQQVRSIVSGRLGHKQEFAVCHETREPIALDEAEKCEITGHPVRIGVLERCEISGKKVLPIGLDRCAITGKRTLKKFLVTSSLSETRVLEKAAIRSANGLFCTPTEAATCVWTGYKYHPDDIRKCELTGLPVHFGYITPSAPFRLRPLIEMLDGIKRNSDRSEKWHDIAELIAAATKGGKCHVQAAILSPDNKHLATCSERRAMLGMRVYQVGALFDLTSNSVVGRICTGKRSRESWSESEHR
jgi:hypothetical protein